jgi:hypothetical protein
MEKGLVRIAAWEASREIVETREAKSRESEEARGKPRRFL